MAAVGQSQDHLASWLGKALSLGLKMMFGLNSILRKNDLIQRFIHIYWVYRHYICIDQTDAEKI